MSQADRIFKVNFRKHYTNHEGNFPPSRQVALGDYGVMVNGYYSMLGNIKKDFGLEFETRIDDSPTNEQFESEGQVSTNFIAKGSISAAGIPAVKAGLELSFDSSESVFFSSPEVKYNEISNLARLGESLLALYKEGKWKKKYVVISKVMEGANAILVISGSSGSKVMIEATSPEIASISLADASLKLGFANSSKLSYKIITNGTTQIGFGLSRVFNPLFIEPTFKVALNKDQHFSALDENTQIDEHNLAFGDIQPENYA